MSLSYPEYPNTNFPEQVDSWDRLQDLTPDDIPLKEQYQGYINSGDITAANQLLEDNPHLKTKIINATVLNNALDGVKGVQKFFKENVNGYIDTKQTEINDYVDTKKQEMQAEIDRFDDKDNFNPTTLYYKNNFVAFNDGSGIKTYLCINDNNGLGITGIDPTISTNWRVMTITGQKGEDGIGIGLAFKNAWDINTIYSKDDGVQYGGAMFASLIDNNVGNEPDLAQDTPYWAKALDVAVTVSTLKGIRNLASEASNINFMTGEITSFNPLVDELTVIQGVTTLVEDIHYTINTNNQSIDKVEGTWDGSAEPILFEFKVLKNIVNNLVFSDGSAISEGTITKSKLTTDVQSTLDQVATNQSKIDILQEKVRPETVLNTTSQNLTGAVNELLSEVNSLTQTNLQQSLEILDLKMKLEEQNLIGFINKTGVGFYDLFDTTENVDSSNTTAIVNIVDKKVEFPSKQNFIVKSIGDFTSSTDIKVDGKVVEGDRLNSILVKKVTIQNEATNHVITDAIVVDSAYGTSRNARPQYLSNGWIITSTYDSTNTKINLYVSKDNFSTTPILLGYHSMLSTGTYSIQSKGTWIYILRHYSNSASGIEVWAFDASMFTEGQEINTSNGAIRYEIDTGQTGFNLCSLTINPEGTELHACWSSKNSIYPNSFNIRYAKGAINSDSSVTWGSVEQVTINNSSGIDVTEPSIITSDNKPKIVYILKLTATYRVMIHYFDGTTWTNNDVVIYDSTSLSYTQSSPCVIFVPQSVNSLTQGRIWVTWHGSDSTTSYNNIRVSYSDDGGVTWSSMENITNSTTNHNMRTSITANKNNKIFITFDANINTQTTYYVVQKISNENGIPGNWGSPSIVTSNTTANSLYSSTLFDQTYTLNFSEPLFIYQDNQNSKVGFYGTWDTIKEQFYPVLDSPITTIDGEELSVIPNPFSTLQFKQEIFDNISDIELRLYPEKINKATIDGDVNNSTNITVGKTDKELVVGDKLWLDNAENEIVTATGNFTIHDVQDTMVANSAYSTSDNGGRKLVRLDNGWLVFAVIDEINTSDRKIRFYINKDNMQTTPTELCYRDAGSTDLNDVALVTDGVYVYVLYTRSNIAFFNVINPSTQVYTNIGVSAATLDTQNEVSNCSLTVNPEETELHACWSSKNSTYPNSFNIRYCKGTINGDGSVTWGSVEQISKINTSGNNAQSPSILINTDNNPLISCIWLDGGNYYPVIVKKSGLSLDGDWNWTFKMIFNGGAYIQSSPSAILVPQSVNGLPQGRIWVAWRGTDSGDSTYSIRVSYSDDGGTTWSAMEKLTSNNTYWQPSITVNKNNEIFIMFNSGNSGAYGLYQIKNNNGTWVMLNRLTTTNDQSPSTLLASTLDFEKPLVIYKDTVNNKVIFTGKWTIGEGYDLTLTDPATLTDGQQIPIVDFLVEQASSAMILKNIDPEKYEFDISGLSTTTSDIKVSGKENSLNSIVYAIS